MPPRPRYGLVVPLSLLVLAPGCYASHPGGTFDGGPGPRDVATDPRFDAPRDVGVDARDGGTDVPVDAPFCEIDVEDRPETVCTITETGDFPAGEAFDLNVRWSACRCQLGRSCEVRVEDGLIDIRSRSCFTDVECDDCAFEGQCAVPALAPGPYRLRVDGRDVYDVMAIRQPAGPRRRPRCYEVPDAPDAALTCRFAWDDRALPAQVCYHRVEDVGTYVAFDVTAACRGCFDWSAGCAVERDGEVLLLRPHLQTCECPTCGACAEPCSPTEVTCRSVALRDGLYQVFVASGDDGPPTFVGELVVEDVAGPGPEICFPIE